MKIRAALHIVVTALSLSQIQCGSIRSKMGKTYTDQNSKVSAVSEPNKRNELYNRYKNGYRQLWRDIRLTDESSIERVALRIKRNKTRYESIENQTGVPWFVVGIIHDLEGGGNFRTHLHNGDSLSRRTVNVPAGRPKSGSAPFTWEESALDSLAYEGFSAWNKELWQEVEVIAYAMEVYNGLGYRTKGIHSPYLWSKTNHYTRGKYVKDGVYDPYAISYQVGAMATLKYGIDKGYWVIGKSEQSPENSPYCRVAPTEGDYAPMYDTIDPSSRVLELPLGLRLKRLKVESSQSKFKIDPKNQDDVDTLKSILGEDLSGWIANSQLSCEELSVGAICFSYSVDGFSIPVREDADAISDIYQEFYPNYALQVEGIDQEWVDVSYRLGGVNHRRGWVHKRHLDCSKNQRVRDAMYHLVSCQGNTSETSKVLVRDEPNPSGRIVMELEDGVPVSAYARSNRYVAVHDILAEEFGIMYGQPAFIYDGQLQCEGEVL